VEGGKMPYVSIWIHLIWATKNRQPYLNKNIRQKILKHIRENAQTKGINLLFINGIEDHVHSLILLKANQNIADVAKFLKGESSHWINKHNLINDYFEWQDDYFAISINKVQLKKVIGYIKNQELHHQKKSLSEEYQNFIDNN
jgi:putative transposase